MTNLQGVICVESVVARSNSDGDWYYIADDSGSLVVRGKECYPTSSLSAQIGDNGGGGASPASIAGIVLGGVVLLILAGLGGWFCLHRRRRRLQGKSQVIKSDNSSEESVVSSYPKDDAAVLELEQANPEIGGEGLPHEMGVPRAELAVTRSLDSKFGRRVSSWIRRSLATVGSHE